jgi:hypothetical protein
MAELVVYWYSTSKVKLQPTTLGSGHRYAFNIEAPHQYIIVECRTLRLRYNIDPVSSASEQQPQELPCCFDDDGAVSKDISVLYRSSSAVR